MLEPKSKKGPYKRIEEAFVDKFLEAESSGATGYTLKTGKVGEKVVTAYKNVENAVVSGYQRIEDTFVDTFLEKKTVDPAEDDKK